MKLQMARSATSVPGNIAEGSAKRSQKDYARYVEIALGSTFELDTHLLIVKRRKWTEVDIVDQLLTMVVGKQCMLQSFIKKLD